MTEIIYMAGGILGLFMLVMLMAAVSLWRRGRRQAGTALILLLVLVLAVGGYGISMFRASSQQAAEAQADSYECSTLAEKILPVREMVLAMKSEGDRQLQQDARDLQQHKENMSQGEYGLVAKGDPESRLVPALGEPAYVNQPGGEGEPRQYVFNHHSRNIYVYTKNGIVTDVRGM